MRSIAAQLGYVASGLGYALVPAYATKLAMAGVAFVRLREALDSVPLSLVWNEAVATPQLAVFREQVELTFPRQPRRQATQDRVIAASERARRGICARAAASRARRDSLRQMWSRWIARAYGRASRTSDA